MASPQPLRPQPFTRFGEDAAGGNAIIVDEEEVLAVRDRRWNIVRCLAIVPKYMSLGDVALAVGPDPHQMIRRVACRQDRNRRFECRDLAGTLPTRVCRR